MHSDLVTSFLVLMKADVQLLVNSNWLCVCSESPIIGIITSDGGLYMCLELYVPLYVSLMMAHNTLLFLQTLSSLSHVLRVNLP